MAEDGDVDLESAEETGAAECKLLPAVLQPEQPERAPKERKSPAHAIPRISALRLREVFDLWHWIRIRDLPSFARDCEAKQGDGQRNWRLSVH
jgi:hypothetical protein